MEITIMYILVVSSLDISTACLSCSSVSPLSQIFTLLSLTVPPPLLLQTAGDLTLDEGFSAADGKTWELILAAVTSGGRLGAMDDRLQVNKPHSTISEHRQCMRGVTELWYDCTWLSQGHSYWTVITFRVHFIVFTSLTLVVVFVFIYCISLALQLPFFNKLELSWTYWTENNSIAKC